MPGRRARIFSASCTSRSSSCRKGPGPPDAATASASASLCFPDSQTGWPRRRSRIPVHTKPRRLVLLIPRRLQVEVFVRLFAHFRWERVALPLHLHDLGRFVRVLPHEAAVAVARRRSGLRFAGDHILDGVGHQVLVPGRIVEHAGGIGTNRLGTRRRVEQVVGTLRQPERGGGGGEEKPVPPHFQSGLRFTVLCWDDTCSENNA
mmetsp:Transcript_17614/g.44000  ORF Transcript_17614/g.44000 Transcript_17614/m.44000 type:complete len:205 (-) Transcript_17614:99-713(-)